MLKLFLVSLWIDINVNSNDQTALGFFFLEQLLNVLLLRDF